MSVQITTLEELTSPSRAASSSLSIQEYFLNMGPQHPIAHGSLRLLLVLDGEIVREVIPVPGFVHRGIEKMCEHLTCRQIVHLTDRMDYLSALSNNWCLSRTVERAAGIETNERIETVRTIVAELQRVQSHALWWGVLGMDLGALTPFLYAFRDREIISTAFEETIGARLTMNYIQPGGLMFDIHPGFVARVKEVLAHMRPILDEYDALLSGNVILQERLRNVGVLPAEKALAMGCTGPVLRGSGVALDLRKAEPYGVYEKAAFDVVVGTVGDCVRMEEMRQSLGIVEQLIDSIPAGPHMTVKPAAKIKLPAGMHYGQIETPRGILGTLIVSDGKSDKPWRVHFRTPNYNNLWAVTAIAPGCKIADIIAIQASLDLVIPDIDR